MAVRQTERLRQRVWKAAGECNLAARILEVAMDLPQMHTNRKYTERFY